MAFRTATDLDFLSANIHGRRSRLAEADRLDQLCRIRSLPALARALFPESRFLTAAHLQRVLVLDQVEELSTIASKIGGPSGRFLDWLRIRFQMENLKVLARGFASGMGLGELGPHLIPLPDDLALNTDVLGTAGTIEAFAAVCPNDVLRAGLERAVDLYNETPRPFFVEAGLDSAYFGELLARAKALGRAHRDEVLAIARQEADTFHLMLVARGRFHYEVAPAALERFHVAGTNLARALFRGMCGAESLAEAARTAVGRILDDAPPKSRGGVAPADLEALAWNRYWRLANRTFRRSHMGLGAVVAYAAIRRIELANLIRLTEGIRAGLSPQAIRRRMIPRSDLPEAGS
jgi:vacuolar-type H+-ATPase subunit C/Vma6